MASELVWAIETIPDTDSVFMRAHFQYFRNGELQPGVFRTQDDGMSVNWDRYASAEETKQQASKNPDDNAVIKMPVADIRGIAGLKVKHIPEPANRAHSNVHGLPESHEQRTEVRVLLLRITEIVIPLSLQ